jgi:hypothetical protein
MFAELLLPSTTMHWERPDKVAMNEDDERTARIPIVYNEEMDVDDLVIAQLMDTSSDEDESMLLQGSKKKEKSPNKNATLWQHINVL